MWRLTSLDPLLAEGREMEREHPLMVEEWTRRGTLESRRERRRGIPAVASHCGALNAPSYYTLLPAPPVRFGPLLPASEAKRRIPSIAASTSSLVLVCPRLNRNVPPNIAVPK